MNSLNQLMFNLKEVVLNTADACQCWVGRGDEKAADQAAVLAMRNALNSLPINGRIVIGEGERDAAPMLHIGELVGQGGLVVDIAVDPLEGTTICANAGRGALAVLAITERGNLLHAPDVYMEKIAIGSGLPTDLIDLDAPIKTNLHNLARAKKVEVADLTVTILHRERHKDIIKQVRSAGARVRLINDGDISAVLTTNHRFGALSDMYLGIGGAPEGVLAAAAQKCLGGQIQGRLILDTNSQQRAAKMGILDPNIIYTQDTMVKGDVIFAAAKVTEGDLLAKEQDVLVLSSLIPAPLTKY